MKKTITHNQIEQIMLNKRGLARHIQVSERTIDNYRKEGIITAYKIGSQVRFDWDEVKEQLKARKESN